MVLEWIKKTKQTKNEWMLFVFGLFINKETKNSRKIPTGHEVNQRRLYKREGLLPRTSSILIDFSFCFT